MPDTPHNLPGGYIPVREMEREVRHSDVKVVHVTEEAEAGEGSVPGPRMDQEGPP